MIRRSLLTFALVLLASPARSQAPVFLTQWGGLGSGQGQLKDPYDIVIDAQGNAYVADSFNHRVEKFSPDQTPTVRASWGRLKNLYR